MGERQGVIGRVGSVGVGQSGKGVLREGAGVARKENHTKEIDAAARQDNPNEGMYRMARLVCSSDEEARQDDPNDETDSGLEGLESEERHIGI